MGLTAQESYPCPHLLGNVGLNQQAIANPITGTIPKFIRRIPCQKSQVSP
jgi:hypothetical protein